MIAVYMRASARHQSVKAQREALRRWAQAEGTETDECVEYIDRAQSGAKRSRPAFDHLLADVRAGRVSIVVATRLDRLGRSACQLHQLADELRGLGVRMALTEQGIDTRSSVGRLVFGILASLAEMEREQLLERLADGRAARRRAGLPFGRPQALQGDRAAQARAMVAAGGSIKATAQALGVSRTAVRSALGD